MQGEHGGRLLDYLEQTGLHPEDIIEFSAIRRRDDNERLWQAAMGFLEHGLREPKTVSSAQPARGRAKSLMLVGTASNVGKSVLATALCRILRQDGWDVAPFKAQNMSLNSAVTPSGREIGRAQAVQAEACGIPANEHMNPVLLKPTGSQASQIVLQGQVYGSVSARAYFTDEKTALWQAVEESYAYLAERHQVIVIEGAGSPVEVNLKSRDIANFRTAAMADADVLLVADIDRGGVFAAIVGTLQLLDPSERARVKGILINRFRGNPGLFEEGVRWLEQHTGIPVVGVIPYIEDLGIDEEDSVSLTSPRYRSQTGDDSTDGVRRVRVAIIQLPHIANFTDFDPLFLEPQVEVCYCRHASELADAAAVVLPGTKSTLLDLAWLREQGFFSALRRHVEAGGWLLGICGGFQMLGTQVADPHRIEGGTVCEPGLGVLPMTTQIGQSKRTVQVSGELLGRFAGIRVRGYEIHMGQSQVDDEANQTRDGAVRPFAQTWVRDDAHRKEEGCITLDGRVIGTYLHGILHNDEFRRAWLREICAAQGIPYTPASVTVDEAREAALNRLAAVVRRHIRMDLIYQCLR
ncbi:cobyric acid synthase [Alicyclobacillus herbarius]|uniref:cobyric acid synthase n=1 Tax=Alicyclobacillus herbarius TaxID=122960 RepID=UPI0023545F0A|nr:cobyric acid synthase [Alicyclobacillus herbarius]